MSLIPDKTPDGREIKAVCVHLSGGCDSSLLLYQVAKEAKARDIKTYAMTVRRPRPTNPPVAKKVVAKINELLKMEIEHLLYYPPLETEEEKYYANEHYQAEQNLVNFSEDLYQLSFSGLTTNPPMEVQKTFMVPDHGLDNVRGEGVKKNLDRFLTMEDAIEFTEKWSGHKLQVEIKDTSGHTWSKRPYFDMNKKDIADLYKKEKLMKKLFPITRSCESETQMTGHCGECWWCQERMWAFGCL